MTYRLQAIDNDGRTRLIPRESTLETEQEWRNGTGSLIITARSTRTPGTSARHAYLLFGTALKHPAEGVAEYRIVDEAGKVIEGQEIAQEMAA